ncbi:unnamed protein product [Durusdinium trenchii]|uniref:Uncharacterized protein n=1 Tax=Durusdinium trenchii TaxID=1381693 RepID=A0ABP0J082_9DINO
MIPLDSDFEDLPVVLILVCQGLEELCCECLQAAEPACRTQILPSGGVDGEVDGLWSTEVGVSKWPPPPTGARVVDWGVEYHRSTGSEMGPVRAESYDWGGSTAKRPRFDR